MGEPRRASDLGIVGWDTFEYVAEDLPRAEAFFREKMDIPKVGARTEAAARASGHAASLYRAGKVDFLAVAPTDPDAPAARWLRRHPEGVWRLAFRVQDAAAARDLLGARGATFTTPLVEEPCEGGGTFRWFEITTPLGEVRFRFVQRPTGALPPGFVAADGGGAANRNGFQVIDHVTSNFLTLEPWVTWLRDVLGFEEYWRVRFHTSDVRPEGLGSGLASVVMWDPGSGVKMANNEPLAPHFERSQIYTFVEDNAGPGVQHVAFHVPHIQDSVRVMAEAGVRFLPTPAAYYDMLPKRLSDKRVGNFCEDADELRRLGILVDGEDDRYLLQIFSVEQRNLVGDPRGGPFFWEIIQRRGARGFGEGNFRALFEAIERGQDPRLGAGG